MGAGVGLHVAVQVVEERHRLGDRHVVGPPLEGIGHVGDQPVRGLDDGDVRVAAIAVAGGGEQVGSGHGQAPQPVEEPGATVQAEVLPVDVLLGRLDRQVRQAQRVGTQGVDDLLGCDQVPLGLGHLGAVEADHALGEQPGERLAQRGGGDAQVRQRLGEEAGVHQVQHGVLGPADVLVDRHPVLHRLLGERGVHAPRVAEAQEVPRRVDEGVHRVGLAGGGAAAVGARGVQEPLVEAQRRLSGGAELDVVGREHGQFVERDGSGPAGLAVHDRDRTSPEPLAAHQPVPEPEVDGALAVPGLFEPGDRGVLGRRDLDPVEVRTGDGIGIDRRVHVEARPGVRLAVPAVGTFDGLDDRDAERGGEVPVALVLARHRHHRAGAVGGQHVVGQVDRHRGPREGVEGVGTGGAAPVREGALGREAVDLGGVADPLHERVDLGAPLRGGDDLDERVLGGEHAERHPVAGVGSGGEHPDVGDTGKVGARRAVGVDDGHLELGALGPADPVALLGDDPLGPLDQLEVVEELLGVVGDPQVPLLEVAPLDRVAGALAAPVDDLLVGEHGLASRTPVDRRRLAVGQAGLEQLQEDPLGPVDVLGAVAAHLAAPVVDASDAGDRAAQHLDALVGEGTGVHPGVDRRVLGGQPEAVEAHRRQHRLALHGAVAGEEVAEGVVADVAHVRRTGGVRVHAQHVAARAGVVVVDFVGAALTPVRLPARFDLLGAVGVDRRRVGGARGAGAGSFGHGRQTTDGTEAARNRRRTVVVRSIRDTRAGRLQCRPHGAVAQLGERFHGMEEVVGSIPIGSTPGSVGVPHGTSTSVEPSPALGCRLPTAEAARITDQGSRSNASRCVGRTTPK